MLFSPVLSALFCLFIYLINNVFCVGLDYDLIRQSIKQLIYIFEKPPSMQCIDILSFLLFCDLAFAVRMGPDVGRVQTQEQQNQRGCLFLPYFHTKYVRITCLSVCMFALVCALKVK